MVARVPMPPTRDFDGNIVLLGPIAQLPGRDDWVLADPAPDAAARRVRARAGPGRALGVGRGGLRAQLRGDLELGGRGVPDQAGRVRRPAGAHVHAMPPSLRRDSQDRWWCGRSLRTIRT